MKVEYLNNVENNMVGKRNKKWMYLWEEFYSRSEPAMCVEFDSVDEAKQCQASIMVTWKRKNPEIKVSRRKNIVYIMK